MHSLRVVDEVQDVGHKARRYFALVASHLVCDVTSETTRYLIELQHNNQLRLDL